MNFCFDKDIEPRHVKGPIVHRCVRRPFSSRYEFEYIKCMLENKTQMYCWCVTNHNIQNHHHPSVFESYLVRQPHTHAQKSHKPNWIYINKLAANSYLTILAFFLTLSLPSLFIPEHIVVVWSWSLLYKTQMFCISFSLELITFLPTKQKKLWRGFNCALWLGIYSGESVRS